ncbi:MAG TPA: fibrillarin-like rRNA/tRNA 2'-O-methyltransferase [Candidatus Nanoarchaeia archaeon]|nr:fibrillarin-like rRNA/tRNA 2'-O-methyltransferase [Candidatus Nanoarchaeia archaeon]
MIKPSKIFEIYESGDLKRKQLYTLNLTPSINYYGEKLVTEDGKEYREWDVFKSKLAATVLKGCTNVFIRKNDVILYLGSASGTTISHVSDMIGEKGFVFAVDLAPRVMRDLIFLCYKRKNVAPILCDASKTDILKEKISAVDVIYQDVAQKRQVDIFLKNTKLFLKDGGYALLALKSRSIDVTKNPRQIYKEVKERLEKELTVVDYRELDPFQKDHCMFICKKK